MASESDKLGLPAAPCASAPELGFRPPMLTIKPQVKLSFQNVAAVAGSSKPAPREPKRKRRPIVVNSEEAAEKKKDDIHSFQHHQPHEGHQQQKPQIPKKQNIVRFSESVAEDLPSSSRHKNSTRGEIPAELLSQMGLVYIPKKSSISNTQPTSSSHAEVEQTKDAVFTWPFSSKYRRRRNLIVKSLVSSRGMFSTLFGLLRDVTGSHPIVSNIRCGNETIEVAYASDIDGEDILLFGLHIASGGKVLRLLSASQVLNHLKDAILFRWGSFERAFSKPNEDVLDGLLNNTLVSLTDPKHFLFQKEPSIIRISSPVKQILDEELYEFETSAANLYGRSNSSTKSAKHLFDCIGSVLFLKDKLLVSHLSVELQQQMYNLFMTELNMWRKVSKWESLKEVVVSSKAHLPRICQINTSETPASEIKEQTNGCLAIMVGHDYLVLGFILEPIVKTTEMNQENSILWIQKALRILKFLVEQDYVIKINQMAEQPIVLKLACSSCSSYATLAGSKKKLKQKSKPKPKSKVVEKEKSKSNDIALLEETKLKTGLNILWYPTIEKVPITKADLLKHEFQNQYEIEDNGQAHSSVKTGTTGSDTESFKLSEDLNSCSGCGSQKTKAESIEEKSEAVIKGGSILQSISIMKENLLYHFIHLEFGRGLILNSTEMSQDVFQTQLMETFLASARVTHGILQRAVKARIGLGENNDKKKWLSHSLAPINEHGSLFQCQILQTGKKFKKKKDKIRFLRYWVIGRLYGLSQEIFVCYEDGKTSENVIESAFKLAHSISI